MSKAIVTESTTKVNPFGRFKQAVETIVHKSGESVTVTFEQTDGKYIARISNGVKIVGNSQSCKVLVKFGSGHKAAATI